MRELKSNLFSLDKKKKEEELERETTENVKKWSNTCWYG